MLALTLTFCTLASTRPLPPFKPAPREFRAAWVATVDNIDWPSKKTLASDQQQKELEGIFDVAAKANLNAIVLQIRTSCDALYSSKLEPWSEFLTGRQGKAPEPFYDPLAYAIELAHARGIELHVWFNPYRAKHFKATGPLAPSHVFNTRPDLAKPYGRYIWLDPGEPDTPTKTLDVMLDVVRRYDVDGIHIDDYFYPYAEKGAGGETIPFPDDASFQKYMRSGGTLGKKDWRRKNVDDFIKKMYSSVKAVKPWVKVGISPFGIARPNLPEGIKAGIDQFDDPLYADCRKWFREGWCDYFTPQLYWTIDSPGQPYKKLLKWWTEQNSMGRALWPGNYTGRVFQNNGNWPVEEIENQILATRATPGAEGNVHYSFKCFAQNEKGLVDRLLANPYKSKAMVPSMPWLSKVNPAPLEIGIRRESDTIRLTWEADRFSRRWAVYRLRSGKWELVRVLPYAIREFVVPAAQLGPGAAVAVTALSPTGIESVPTIVEGPVRKSSNSEPTKTVQS